MNAIRNWFTPAIRERLYTAIAALAPILVTAGVLLPTQVEPILAIVAASLQAFGGVLALSHLKPTEAARWFGTVGRGVIYSGAAGVAVAVVALGIVTQDWANTALQYTSFGLTALAAILAVVTPKEVSLSPGDVATVDAVVVNNAVVAVSPVTVETVQASAVDSVTLTQNAVTRDAVEDGAVTTEALSLGAVDGNVVLATEEPTTDGETTSGN